MVKKKVSKKKSIDNKNLILGVVVILLLIGVFWYFNNQGVYFNPGEDGEKITEEDINVFEKYEKEMREEFEKSRIKDWGCCKINCEFSKNYEESIEFPAGTKMVKKTTACRKMIKKNCLKNNGGKKGPGEFQYLDGYKCSGVLENKEIFDEIVRAKVMPLITMANKFNGKNNYRPWRLGGLEGHFPTELAIDKERSEVLDIDRELYCTWENAKKSDEGRSALEVQKIRCLDEARKEFGRQNKCKKPFLNNVFIKEIIYTFPIITSANFINKNYPYMKPLCGVIHECAFKFKCNPKDGGSSSEGELSKNIDADGGMGRDMGIGDIVEDMGIGDMGGGGMEEPPVESGMS